MSRAVRIVGFLLAAGTVSSVALAQLSGGQPSDASGDRLERPRLTRPVERRQGGAVCRFGTCAEPPRAKAGSVRLSLPCDGGLMVVRRDGAGRIAQVNCVTAAR